MFKKNFFDYSKQYYLVIGYYGGLIYENSNVKGCLKISLPMIRSTPTGIQILEVVTILLLTLYKCQISLIKKEQNIRAKNSQILKLLKNVEFLTILGLTVAIKRLFHILSLQLDALLNSFIAKLRPKT